MQDDIAVRQAQLDDAETIAEFNIAMAQETENKKLDPRTILAGVHGLLNKPEYGFYLVAESGGRIAGCLLITFEWSDWRNGLFWWIQSVYVLPEFRRQGVYRRLYNAVQERGRKERVCGFRLYVEKENLAAMQTYCRLGMFETPYRIYERETCS
ncbi:MAG TPA: GNAT family N-acetyltransferase [bacterium]|nr:GNAT family N-acetyltransferase [bacterium]HNT66731.1 GNAT family N-acetyltransferase [bacterium]